MKAVILAGGFGTRIGEETATRPKPMVEIGGRPILWHIMKMYQCHGITEFIICCGYKGYVIKEYFSNYFLYMSDVTFDMATNSMEIHKKNAEPWKVTLVDTGEHSMTGGRLGRVRDYLSQDEVFCFTYGDGLGDIDIAASIDFHKSHGKLATVTATFPPGRFGALSLEKDRVVEFVEKPQGDGYQINGGFFVLSSAALNYVDGDDTVWENDSLARLAEDQQLMAFQHPGFWQPMDTIHDRRYLEMLWQENRAPWATWE